MTHIRLIFSLINFTSSDISFQVAARESSNSFKFCKIILFHDFSLKLIIAKHILEQNAFTSDV